MDTGTRYPGHQRQPPLVDNDVMLATELAAIGRVWAIFAVPGGGGDGTLAESLLARSHFDLIVFPQSLKHRVMQLLPKSGLLPVAKPSSASHSRTTPQFLWQVLPEKACAQHEQNAG